jgi:hypothetical protein
VGARLYGQIGKQIEWDVEGAYQFDYRGRDVSAGFVGSQLKYYFSEKKKTSPWITVGFDYASGDDDPGDEVFKVRPANPNVSIGLVLYDLMLAERSRTAWAAEDGMWSRGGVYNSYFFMQTVRYEPIDGLEVIVAFLQAWKDEEDGGVYPRRDERFLGFETDIAVKYHFHGDHAHVGIEGGVLHLGKAFKDPALNMPDDTWTIQLWTAFTP